MNPILFSDLFDSNIASGISSLRDAINAFKTDTENALESVRKKADELNGSLKGTSSASEEGRNSIKKVAVSADELTNSYAKLTAQEQEVVNLAREIASTEKDLTSIDKLQVKISNEKETSYNRLSATYSALKIAINAMTQAEREDMAVGGKYVEMSRAIYEQMNKMQQATGKYTLQVGQYTKAMGGLNLSMAQVIREAPTLGNSLNQFAVAISNNIPILMDNIQRYNEANKQAKERLSELMKTMSKTEAMKAMGSEAANLTSVWGALGKSLLSLNTIVVGIILVFEILTKAIDKKRRAQKEANSEEAKAVTYAGLLRSAYAEIDKEVAKSVGKLKTLYNVTQDANRSMEDRHKAAEVLKQDFKDNFKNYSEEEIVLGKAKIAYDELTKSLVTQAKARAYLNRITDLQTKYIDQEVEQKKAKDALTEANNKLTKAEDTLARAIENGVRGEGLSIYSKALEDAKKGVEDATAAFIKADMPLQDIQNTISTLEGKIPVIGKSTKESSLETKDALSKSKDYYWTWRESVANIIQDEQERELELNDITYGKRIEALNKELEAQKKNGTLRKDNEAFILDTINNLTQEKLQKRGDIIQSYYDKIDETVRESSVQEQDFSISGQYEAQLAPLAKMLIDSRKKINDELQKGNLSEVRQEAADFKAMTVQKLTLEKELKEALLKLRLDTGAITQNQYDIELQKIQQSFDKSIDRMSKQKGKKFNLATMLFGTTKVDEFGNVTKELGQGAQSAFEGFKNVLSQTISYMNEWIDKRIEMAEVAIQAAKTEADSAKTALDYEQEARANGYANNVELARREYEEKLRIEKEATAEKERLQKVQEAINTATQVSSLITATAQLLAAYAFIPFVGQGLATAAIAAMWSTFAASKIAAASITSYGEGGMEYIDYGGSHASGHDVDFGRTKEGNPRRIERGEVVAVVNKRNVNKYGVAGIESIINSLNNGTFETKYGTSSNLVDSLSQGGFESKYGLAFAGIGLSQGADLNTIESGIGTLVEQGKSRVVPTSNGYIEYRGNYKRIVRNS